MGIWKWISSCLLAASLFGLVGCADTATVETKEKELQEKIAQLEKELALYKKREEERQKEEKAKEEEEKEPEIPVVQITHPQTNEVIEALIPIEMGYKTEDDQYKKALTNWAKALARGTDSTAGYDQRMILDKIGENGEIIKGRPQVILDEAELVEAVLQVSETGGKVQLPLYLTESGYTPDEIPTLDEVVVASYTTYFNPSVEGRTKNIELSAKAIHNVILGVGDAFSFNTTVGPSDEAHGYQPAEEINNGKIVMGIGGGICQTSSTLYNAIDILDVTYVELHNHSLEVAYVPKGRDATVSYGGLDFRFQNTTGAPLLITTHIENGALTVEIRTSKNKEKQI
ncbi:VanW family protein [Bacillus sp. FJAT-45066]|uniref:VanW family protein n=1 Tax=Bacillus sp. FJAT-45066 TaxID=2011010 RepID=UPI000BB790A0|nr:VanW family protein [Bacillus sp. FJAT-45066]